ncbi:hypothetical protein [Paenibacillus monticola]|uniref:Uncharacterized protein n=1 Tax=Paenibacillus monticola TaxID=2666075 RepID=A0A7X2H0T0_9BACL|nr:hypothetical protein [Paenibacillus monticola]MRN51476.1 hypothetical protein [Paenibacillus monticola]
MCSAVGKGSSGHTDAAFKASVIRFSLTAISLSTRAVIRLGIICEKGKLS